MCRCAQLPCHDGMNDPWQRAGRADGGVYVLRARLVWQADLCELGRTPVMVVSAGAKSILDLPKTLEVLETHGVTVLGFGTDEFPAFFTPKSGLKLPHHVRDAEEAAKVMHAKWALGLSGGLVVANPVPEAEGFDAGAATEQAMKEAIQQGIEGKALTPFLLQRIAEITDGQSLTANVSLVKHNAMVGTAIAVAYASLQTH